MGWSQGSEYMDIIIEALNLGNTSESQRLQFYIPVILRFCQEDWDTQDTCIGKDPAFDCALYLYENIKGYRSSFDKPPRLI